MTHLHKDTTIHVKQGDFATSNKPDVILSAVLGSCVAACLFDPVAEIGGMNHFLLPDSNTNGVSVVIYGAQAMELLINELLKNGGQRSRLQAKLFGGASVLDGLSNIGARNAQFATEYLQNEGITCISQSLHGTQARRVRFWPTSGRASQKLIGQTAVVAEPQPSIRSQPDVELF